MFCSNCGARLENGAAFCHACGAKVVGVPIPPKKRNVLLIALLIVAAIAVIAVAALVFVLLRGGNDGGNDPVPVVQSTPTPSPVPTPTPAPTQPSPVPQPTPETTQPIQWQTVSSEKMTIDIPSSWSYEISDDGLDDIYITSEDGTIFLFVGYMIAGDPNDFIRQNHSQSFQFDDGSMGYMFELDDSILWINPNVQPCCGMSFYFDDNSSLFTDNEDLILMIAKSLTQT